MPKSRHRKKNPNRQYRSKNQDEFQNIESNNSNEDASVLEKTFIDQEVDIADLQGKGERFINDNKSMVLGITGVFLLLLLAYLLLTRIYGPGQEADAQAEMVQAQQYFAQDSFNLALNGDGNYAGFLEIIDNYDGLLKGNTKSGNLANYYAGVSYLNMGNYEEAINYLSNFDGNDIMLSAMAQGAIGDANMELGNTDKGIAQYKKAATMNENDLTSPLFYLKAGMALESKGDFTGAKAMYEKLKEFPNSQQGRDADKYITRAAAAM